MYLSEIEAKELKIDICKSLCKNINIDNYTIGQLEGIAKKIVEFTNSIIFNLENK